MKNIAYKKQFFKMSPTGDKIKICETCFRCPRVIKIEEKLLTHDAPHIRCRNCSGQYQFAEVSAKVPYEHAKRSILPPRDRLDYSRARQIKRRQYKELAYTCFTSGPGISRCQSITMVQKTIVFLIG